MRRTSSFGLGLSVCGAVAALAVAPARADDGATVPVDPAAIVASVAAAVPSMPEPQGPTAPQLPDPPETTVIPPVSAAVPPVIPPAPVVVDTPQSTSTEPTTTPATAPATPAAPVVATPSESAPAPQPAPAPAAAPATADTANTTTNNSHSITPTAPTTPSQTFIWNWYWNCATDEGTPAVPAPPAGATTIVLNWHWACAEPPPTLDVAGATICVSCNIAISVRVGSPGNTGDLAQTIAAQTAATAAGIAQTIQTALQTAPPAGAPLPPAPLPDAPPAVIPTVGTAPAFVTVAVPAPPAYPIDAGILVTTFDDLSVEDGPRHGAPLSFGAPTSAGRQSAQSSVGSFGGVAGALSTTLIALPPASNNPLSPQRSTAGRTGAGSRSTTAGARRPARAPAAPTAPPSAPDPMVLAAGTPSTHGGGQGVVVAIASALALAFLYAVYSGLRTPSAVPPAGGSGAKPHPPG
jgi:hypothetical protein